MAEDLHLWMSTKGLKVRKIVNPFTHAREERKNKGNEEEGNGVQVQSLKPPVSQLGPGISLPKPGNLLIQTQAAGLDAPLGSPIKKVDFAGFTSLSQSDAGPSFHPKPLELRPGFEWLESTLQEMSSIGLGLGKISLLNQIDPDYMEAHLAVKAIEV